MRHAPNRWQQTVGRNIRKIRKRSGKTQEEVASASDLTSKHLQEIEAGRINLTLQTLTRIAASLHVRPEQFLKQ